MNGPYIRRTYKGQEKQPRCRGPPPSEIKGLAPISEEQEVTRMGFHYRKLTEASKDFSAWRDPIS